MERQKIVWLCSWYPSRQDPFNGDFIQRHALAASMYNDIHVIHLVADETGTLPSKQVEWAEQPGLTEQIIYYPRKKGFWGRILAHQHWLFYCKQAIRNYMIRNGKPALVHVQVPMKAGIAALWFRKRYKVPFIVTEHWGIYNDVAEDRYSTRSFFFRYYTKRIFENTAAFVSVSRFLAEGVNRLVTKRPYQVIPNVADTRHFFYRPHQHPVFRFIHVSNMVPLKNTEGILRSFAALLQQGTVAELIMVGDKDPAIRTFAAEAGIPQDRIRFMGEISYPAVAAAMQESDGLLLFSHIENSPCVIGEALCCGLPVIASAVGGIPELVNESNSLLVPAADEEKLRLAMQEMIDTYNRYDRLAIAMQAASRFSYATVGRQLDEIYRKVLTSS